MTDTLLALLRYSKQAGSPPATWEAVAAALAPLYNYRMTLYDVVRVMVNAYEEVVLEPRYEVAQGRSVVVDLLLSPVMGYQSIEMGGPPAPTATYSMEQVYGAMIRHMLGQFAITRVDWCPEFRRPVIANTACPALEAPAR